MSDPVKPPLPGNVGLTHLKVYDSPGPDGLVGGSPHVHLASTEAYVAIGGRGSVQTLGPEGFVEHPLEAGAMVWFTPGVIHRLINAAELEILVVMQNAGLPEAGDVVMTFPPDILADEQAYAEAASLDARDRVYLDDMDAARRRRDLAVEGFNHLRRRYDEQGSQALRSFYGSASKHVTPKLEAWRTLWRDGALAVAESTGAQLDDLSTGGVEHLLRSSAHHMRIGPQRRFGMCGTLGVYSPEGVVI